METNQYFKPLGKSTAGKLAAVLMILSLLLLGSASPARADSAIVFQLVQEIPIQMTQYLPCAASGAGEILDVSGTLKMVVHGTRMGDGSVAFIANADLSGATGVGRTTGDVYQVVGTDNRSNTYGFHRAETWKYVQNFHIVGQGGNYMVLKVYLEVLEANGEIANSVEFVNIECR